MSSSISRVIRPFQRTCLPLIKKSLNENSLCGCQNTFKYPGYVIIQSRTFFPLPGASNLTKEYSEKKVLGYSMAQFYDIVADVDNYKHFVPWCVASDVFQRSDTHARANLEVGFPPVSEKYTSVLTLAKPNLVKSECMDGTLFNYLTCVWRFSNGPVPNSCTLNFYISFEFKSILHSQLATVFFDQVVVKMVKAFEDRAKELYGQSSLEKSKKLPPRRRPRDRAVPSRPIIIRDPSN